MKSLFVKKFKVVTYVNGIGELVYRIYTKYPLWPFWFKHTIDYSGTPYEAISKKDAYIKMGELKNNYLNLKRYKVKDDD